LIEPMIGAGGGIPATSEFLQGLRKATEASGAMLIFDEVMTSRLTSQGLHGLHQITPDLVTFGKYLGGGLTFGAFGGRADILDCFDPSRANAWPHAGTFNNNILTMTAGYTGLADVFTPAVADEFYLRGNRFRSDLIDAIAPLGLPIQITGMGSMMSFHFANEVPSAPVTHSRSVAGLLELIHLDMMARGQFYARRGMINLSLSTLDFQLENFTHCFTEVLANRSEIIASYCGGNN
jgi:glutamate-1-semialdehyde 2,1-aminomutase